MSDALDQLDNAEPAPKKEEEGTTSSTYLRDQDLEPLQVDPEKLIRSERTYTIFATNDMPESIVDTFIEIGKLLESKWFVFRHTADSYRADQHKIIKALEKRSEGYLLWKGANPDFPLAYPGPNEKAHRVIQTLTNFYSMVKKKEFREKYNMKDIMQDILARNAMLFLGKDLDTPVNLVICYSADGGETKDEGIKNKTPAIVNGAIEIANILSIPIFNLGKPGSVERLKTFIQTFN